MIPSHVKITCYLHLWNEHCFCGYMINHTIHSQKKILKWNVLVFHWCLYTSNNRTLHGFLKMRNFFFHVKKYFTCLNFFQHSKRNFVSLRGHVILCLLRFSVFAQITYENSISIYLFWDGIAISMCSSVLPKVFLKKKTKPISSSYWVMWTLKALRSIVRFCSFSVSALHCLSIIRDL